MARNISGNRLLLQSKVALMKVPSPGCFVSSLGNIYLNQYDELASWIFSEKQVYRALFNLPFPTSFQDWKVSVNISPDIPFENILNWSYVFLKRYSGQINDFIQISSSLDSAYNQEKKEECFEIINSIEKKYGLSYWSLKRRISLLQHFEGLEAQKKYANSIKDTANADGVVKYIAHYISYRSEDAVSPFAFINRYKAWRNDENLSEIAKSYLLYHVVAELPTKESEISNLLLIESGNTVFDHYEAFVVAAQSASVWLPQCNRSLGKLCSTLAKSIKDSRLLRIAMQSGEIVGTELAPGSGSLLVYKQFCQGDYPSAHNTATKLITEGTDDSLTWLLAALSKPDSEAPAFPILRQLNTLAGGDDSPNAAAQIARRIWALQGSSFSNCLKLCLQIESAPEPIPAENIGIRSLLPGLDNSHPFQWRWADGISDRAWLPGYVSQIDCDSPVSESEGHWRTLLRYYSAGDYANALTEAVTLSSSRHFYYRRLGIRFITASQLKLGLIKEAIETAAELFSKDKSVSVLLPVESIIESLPQGMRESLSGMLSQVILCDIYAGKKGFESHHIRRFAYEDFLSKQGILKPSDSLALMTPENKSQYIHFLQNVCVESVMDSSIVFNSSAEVAEERFAVCRLLAEIDPDNIERYQSEMKEIALRLVVKKRLREIEQSKIYVDVKSVKIVAKKELEESYSRYISFLRNGLSLEEKDFFSAVSASTSIEDFQKVLSGSIPQNERAALLENIYEYLRDEYVSSSQHGLDGYLSVRVRHGTLAGQIRGTLELEKLLTKRDAKTNLYKDNTVWPERLGVQNLKRKDAIISAFNTFSTSIDALIDEISKVWIQVKKDPEGVGLIDFTLSPQEIALLSADITEDTSLDEFIDETLQYFSRNRLESSLAEIRKRLQDEVKPQIRALLLDLQKTIEEILPDSDAADLRTAIGHALTNINITLDRIIEWFRIRATEKEEPFSIEEAISICRATRPDFQPKLSMPDNVRNYKIHGNLTSFVDMLFLVFENVVKHADTKRVPMASISAQLSEDTLIIEIRNPIGEQVATESNCARVAEIMSEVRKQAFSTSVKKEGGTGFYKLNKILHHDFCLPGADISPNLNFGFEDKTEFFVRIEIPVMRGENENINS